MLIRNLKLSGWRSFSPSQPVEANKLGRTNLLIGPNNVGKSNLGRFLVKLRNVLADYRSISPWEDNISFSLPLLQKFDAQEVDFWLRGSEPIIAEIFIKISALDYPSAFPEFLNFDGYIKLIVKMTAAKADSERAEIVINIETVDGHNLVINDKGAVKIWTDSGSYTEKITSSYQYRHMVVAACHCIANSVIEIKPLRDPSRKNENLNFGSTDGGEIIHELRVKQNDSNRQKLWTGIINDLEKWFGILLGESEIRIEINTDSFIIGMRRGGENFRCDLVDMGAGVSEILMLLAYLRLRQDQSYFVVIDEPEAHLHPGAVVALVNLIIENMPGHQLLISTHSTALIDIVNNSWSIYRVFRANNAGTAFEEINNSSTELSLLADLGLRPSQLFLARVVLWVEGPSDVNYWTALIKSVDDKLVVGRDYSFVTYGGASASHLEFLSRSEFNEETDAESTNKLVQILSVSHRAVIICDRDRDAVDTDRALILRLIEAAETIPQHARIVKSVGREIENDINPEYLMDVLKDIRPKFFNKPRVNIIYDDYIIGQDDAFDAVVANAAKQSDGSSFTSEKISAIKGRINQAKLRISEEIKKIALSKSVFKDEALTSANALVKWIKENPN